MKTIDCIKKRRSTRSYKLKKIDRDDLFYLVEAGMKAPTAGNLQDYRFIVSTNKKLIYKLPEACLDQAWISQAPGIIAVCSQPKLCKDWYGSRGDVYAIQNASAAVQNILLAAHEIGLGTCWISGFDQEQIDNIFKTDGKARVEAIITVGFPSDKPDKKEEEPITQLLFFDSYGSNKPDLIKLNKDYSIKYEEAIKDMPNRFKNIHAKGMHKFKEIIQKINK